MQKIFVALSIAVLALMLFSACSKEDGAEFKNSQGEYETCETSADCSAGRYCNDKGVCYAECAISRDCYFYDEAAKQAWETAKAQGLTFKEADLPDPTYKCSECGGCIPVDQEVDERCVVSTVTQCEEDQDCLDLFGENYVCSPGGICTIQCEQDEDCKSLGDGHICQEDDARKLCIKWCYNDSSCAYHGYGWECKLPEDVDPEANFFADDPTYGSCVMKDDGPDWGEHVGENPEYEKITGVYGVLLETAFTNCGFPLVNCQNTTNIHLFLFRIRPTADGVEMDGKYCNQEMHNFAELKGDPTRDHVTAFDNLAWMEVPKIYSLSLPLHHWDAQPDKIDIGSKIDTSTYLEVRGARLDDPENDPLPTAENLEGEWDQDRDGKPGMTSVMNGTLTGEVYQSVRFHISGEMEILTMNADGKVEKMKGSLKNDSEQYMLGASKDSLLQDVTSNLYKDSNRSYMRILRMVDDASCKDLIDLGHSEKNCGTDINSIKISTDDDTTWLCHTPTMDGPDQDVVVEEKK